MTRATRLVNGFGKGTGKAREGHDFSRPAKGRMNNGFSP